MYMAFRDGFFPHIGILGLPIPLHREPDTVVGDVVEVPDQAKEDERCAKKQRKEDTAVYLLPVRKRRMMIMVKEEYHGGSWTAVNVTLVLD